jgi:hypothetical protein
MLLEGQTLYKVIYDTAYGVPSTPIAVRCLEYMWLWPIQIRRIRLCETIQSTDFE